MEQLDVSKFNEQCLSLLDQLAPEGIVITKHGKPIARLIPIEAGCANLIGSMNGKIKISGDVFFHGKRVGCSILTATYLYLR